MNTQSAGAGLITLLAFLIITVPVVATPITGPVTIDTPGYYSFASDLTSNETPFITITAPDVFLDGKGFQLIAEPGTAGDAILIQPEGAQGLQNLTVRNLEVSGWDTGLHVVSGYDGAARNLTFRDQGKNGIWLDNTSGFTVHGCYVAGSGLPGIAVSNATENTLTWNHVSGSSDVGIYVVYSKNNHILYNYLDGNHYNGIFLDNSTGNHLSENQADNNGYPGIALATSEKNTLGRNYFVKNQIAQVYIDNATRNQVLGNFGRGAAPMTVTAGDSPKNLIRGNIRKL